MNGVLRVCYLDSVLHQEQVYRDDVRHLYLEHPVNPCNQRLWILRYVRIVPRKHFHHNFELFLEHRLNYELSIVREKEKAARLALGLSRLKHGRLVQLGSQRPQYLVVVNAVHLTQFSEDGVAVVADVDLLADNNVLVRFPRG